MRFSASRRLAAPVVLAAICAAIPRAAHADDFIEAAKKFGQRIGQGIEKVLGLHDTPSVNALKPTITFPKGASPLNPKSFYLVRLNCSIQPLAKLNTSGLLIEQTTFVAHSLWFSDDAGDGSIPANPVKLVNAFSFTRDPKDKDGSIIDFQNDTCSDTFILRGDSDTLTVSFLFADSKTSSGISKALTSAAKILAGIVPLFMEGPLATTVAGAAKAAGDAADPVKEIIESFNKSSRKAVRSVALTTASNPKDPIVIHTAYSDVELTVTAVEDIATQIMQNDKLSGSFKKVFGNMTSSYATGINRDTALDRCAGFAYALDHNYKFAANDQAYLLGFFATLGFPGDINSRLECIGDQRIAQTVLDRKFDFNETTGAFQGFTQDDVNTFDWERKRIRLSSFTAHGYLEALSNYLPKFAQDATGANKASLLTWIGSSQIQLDDSTNQLFPNDSASAEEFINSLTATYKRYGCFIQDAKVNPGTYDAIMLALPLKPASGDTFKRDELMGMYIYLVGTGKKKPAGRILKVAFTKDTNAIKEAAKRFDGQCYTAKIDITSQGTP